MKKLLRKPSNHVLKIIYIAPLVVCPVSNGSAVPNLENRLPHPHDCNKFFLCDNATKIPRPMACEQHQGFDMVTRTCKDKSLLPNW